MTDEANQTPPPETDSLIRERNVVILVFDDVEVLDFAGPFEVFNVTAELNDPSPFHVVTVSENGYPIEARGKLSVNPHHSFEDCIPPDILLIPGGWGTRALMENQAVLDWIKEQAKRVELLLSVCTGALVLGKAGLLAGLNATTHHTAFGTLRQISPTIHVLEDKRYVDNGKIITSGGISAGIDMSLYVVHRLLGDEALAKTLKEMEYEWQQE
jgi:transcriptional regulator GlxA family with amidase domain